MRNFKPAFIDGSRNLRVSCVKEHATSSMHKKAMSLSPIARAFSTIHESTSVTVKTKCDIAYYIYSKREACYVNK